MIKKLDTSLYVASKVSDYLSKNCKEVKEFGRSNFYIFEKDNCINLRDCGKRALIEVSDKHTHYKNIEKIINGKKQ
jgi:hypothetical protein